MLYLIGIVITFFLVIILVSKKGKTEPDKILALWLLFTGIHLLLFYMHFTGKHTGFPYLLGFELPLPLVQGPFLYVYTSSLTNQIRSRKISFLHFAPCILTYLLLLPFFTLSSAEKIFVYQNEGIGYEQLMTIIYGAIIFSGIIYTLLSLQILSLHRKKIADQFSYTEKINLAWLRYLILGTSIIWAVVIFSDDEYIFAAVVLYVLFIGYFGIKQVGIFTYRRYSPEGLLPANSTETEPENLPIISKNIELIQTTPGSVANLAAESNPGKNNKYLKSGLSDASIETIHQQLTALMQHEKLYNNPELTLSELSQKLDVHPNSLSQVINSREQKNFYDYINCQRVEEFKQMILRPESQKFTLLSLAYECGFNSKTTFNRNFKKVTGLSPTEYLNQVNVSIE